MKVSEKARKAKALRLLSEVLHPNCILSGVRATLSENIGSTYIPLFSTISASKLELTNVSSKLKCDADAV